jgi:DNA-binding IclR family transcriptional regulator
MVATADKALMVLSLFTMEKPEWTVDEAIRELSLSSSMAYEYFRSLIDAGLLVASTAGHYALGPTVLVMDRIMRRHDPLIHQAQDIMSDLLSGDLADDDAVALLCRSFRTKVMCVDQRASKPAGFLISYERGLPMPLYRGAASKSILAKLPSRATRRLWDQESDQITNAGLGTTWDDFKKSLRQLRKNDVIVTRGEIDTGLVGISAPVLGPDGDVLGSLGIVATEALVSGFKGGEGALVKRVGEQALRLTARLGT